MLKSGSAHREIFGTLFDTTSEPLHFHAELRNGTIAEQTVPELLFIRCSSFVHYKGLWFSWSHNTSHCKTGIFRSAISTVMFTIVFQNGTLDRRKIWCFSEWPEVLLINGSNEEQTGDELVTVLSCWFVLTR